MKALSTFFQHYSALVAAQEPEHLGHNNDVDENDIDENGVDDNVSGNNVIDDSVDLETLSNRWDPVSFFSQSLRGSSAWIQNCHHRNCDHDNNQVANIMIMITTKFHDHGDLTCFERQGEESSTPKDDHLPVGTSSNRRSSS